MKAAVLSAARTFHISEVPSPTVPDDGLVLDVRACGVCGSDVRRWKEGPPPGSAGVIPGHEVAGVVQDVGRNVSGFSVGDRLAIAPDVHCGECWYCRRDMFNLCDNLRLIGITPGYPGGFAERLVLTGEILTNGIVHIIPDGVSFLEASLSEPCSSVLASQAACEIGPDTTVVVLGAGPIGCLHIAAAHACGARVIVSEPNEQRRSRTGAFSPCHIVDPSRDDVVARVRELTSGLGADVVICANPIAETQTQAVEMVRKAGRVVLFGGLPKASPRVTLDANRIHYGAIQVVGAFSYHPRFHEISLQQIAGARIPARQLITHTYPLDKVDAAFETAAGGDCLKVVVTMSEDGE